MDSSDDFDLLGRAVARVLRDTFAVAAETREAQAQEVEAESGVLAERLALVFAEVEELRARAARRQAEAAAQLEADLATARNEVDAVLAEAREEAAAIRAKAFADAASIVEGANGEVARSRELVAEARVQLDTELKDLVREVHRAVNALERTVRRDHAELFERASSEAGMILRQARQHHRATAKEVDRMIEAAADEAAALRSSALSDAARVAARVRGVVDLDSGRAPGGEVASGERATTPATSPRDGAMRTPRRGLRPLAS